MLEGCDEQLYEVVIKDLCDAACINTVMSMCQCVGKCLYPMAWPERGTYRAVEVAAVPEAWRGHPTLPVRWKNVEVHTLPPSYNHILALTQFALPQNPEGPSLVLGLGTYHWASPQLAPALLRYLKNKKVLS